MVLYRGGKCFQLGKSDGLTLGSLVNASNRRAKSGEKYPGSRGWAGGEGKPGGGYRGVPTGTIRGVPTGAWRGVEEDEPPLKDRGEEERGLPAGAILALEEDGPPLKEGGGAVVSGTMSITT